METVKDVMIDNIKRVDELLVREVCRIRMACQRAEGPKQSWEKLLRQTVCEFNNDEEGKIEQELAGYIGANKIITRGQINKTRKILMYRIKAKKSKKQILSEDAAVQREKKNFNEQVEILKKMLAEKGEKDSIIGYGSYEYADCSQEKLETMISGKIGYPVETTIHPLREDAGYAKDKLRYYNGQTWVMAQTMPVISVRKKV